MCNVVSFEGRKAKDIERSVDASEFESTEWVILSGRGVDDVVLRWNLEPVVFYIKVKVREVCAAYWSSPAILESVVDAGLFVEFFD